ncbi:MAG: hypothetical protein HY928_09155 [Elusimicrobia bacterium]|nr:hypothetical protein [Elusimicrobiota bacterium]
MEQLLRTFALSACAAAMLCACGRPSEADEKRALDRSIAAAQERAHELKMKEINGTELSAEEQAEKQRFNEQAAEDEHGGTLPDEMRPRTDPQEEPPAP